MTKIKKIIIIFLFVLLVHIVAKSYFNYRCSTPAFAPKTTQSIHPNQPKEYYRNEEQTFLTIPEWYIVFATDEYASFLHNNPPHRFDFLLATSQYWNSYCTVNAISKQYPENSSYQTMLVVIGFSQSVEYLAKFAYENSIGRLTYVFDKTNPQDAYIAKHWQSFSTFIHTVPFYRYDYKQELVNYSKYNAGLLSIRGIERKIIFTLELIIKMIYSTLIRMMSDTQAPEAESNYLSIQHPNGLQVVQIPRYEAAKEVIKDIFFRGEKILDIAGNDEIAVSQISNAPDSKSDIFLVQSTLDGSNKFRVYRFLDIINLKKEINSVEHLYDY